MKAGTRLIKVGREFKQSKLKGYRVSKKGINNLQIIINFGFLFLGWAIQSIHSIADKTKMNNPFLFFLLGLLIINLVFTIIRVGIYYGYSQPVYEKWETRKK